MTEAESGYSRWLDVVVISLKLYSNSIMVGLVAGSKCRIVGDVEDCVGYDDGCQ